MKRNKKENVIFTNNLSVLKQPGPKLKKKSTNCFLYCEKHLELLKEIHGKLAQMKHFRPTPVWTSADHPNTLTSYTNARTKTCTQNRSPCFFDIVNSLQNMCIKGEEKTMNTSPMTCL